MPAGYRRLAVADVTVVAITLSVLGLPMLMTYGTQAVVIGTLWPMPVFEGGMWVARADGYVCGNVVWANNEGL